MTLYNVEKYDEELFTILFDFINKIEIKKISIKFYELLSNEDKENFYAKIHKKTLGLKVQNEVSCFF